MKLNKIIIIILLIIVMNKQLLEIKPNATIDEILLIECINGSIKGRGTIWYDVHNLSECMNDIDCVYRIEECYNCFKSKINIDAVINNK